MAAFWALSATMLYLAASVACALAVAWVLRRPVAKRPDRIPTIVALALMGVWAAMAAMSGPRAPSVILAETARNLVLVLVLFRLFAHDGRDKGVVGIRPVVGALAFVVCFQPALLYVDAVWAITPALEQATSNVSALLNVLVAVGALFLLHNLYGGAARSTREGIRWSAAGLASFWAVELNFYLFAFLLGIPTAEFSAIRAGMIGLVAAPLAVGASNGLVGRKLQASHKVTFRLLSLLVIGCYLALVFGMAELVSMVSDDLGRTAQVGFLVVAATVSLLWLPSQRLRGWIKVSVLKHLFQHRYDYREEWMRFTQTIGTTGKVSLSLPQRASKALADIVQSPGATLFLPEDDGRMVEHARWNWAGPAGGAGGVPAELTALMEREGFIVDLSEPGARDAVQSDTAHALLSDRDAWMLIPLLHFNRMVGVVLLAQPLVPRPLDWEDFDLLKVAARQVAATLAEHESQGALMEAAKFDDFNRRMAFVMHDIKNLASQLQLLSRNAEKHADNPAFRQDMLVTLRSSSDKLNTLLARLGRYGTGQTAILEPVDVVSSVQAIAKDLGKHHPVTFARLEKCRALADRHGLEQALVHLIQNAIDASEPEMPVTIDIHSDGLNATIEVVDSGCGMDPEFVRHSLFKPFVSSKDGGFGIGALEARELVRAMGGRLDVQSRPGIGTRFTIAIPLVEAAQLLSNSKTNEAA